MFVSTILWVEELETIKISTVTFMRDFLRGRHVTCQVTLTISSSRPGHVTSTYKVARERYGTNFDCFEFCDSEMVETTKISLLYIA